jgi:hypothetical protein
LQKIIEEKESKIKLLETEVKKLTIKKKTTTSVSETKKEPKKVASGKLKKTDK